MHNGSPLISVIIATYNSARFIAQAIKSVLSQTYSRYEVIIIDDGSTDETKDALREFNGAIRYLYQDNRGPSAARNAGIRLAQGEYICFLDADDLWESNKLELQLNFLEQHSDVGLVFSDEEEISAVGEPHQSLLGRSKFYSDLVDQQPLQDAFRKLLIENFILTSTVMARKACFAEAGLFDENLRVVEDRDLWLRIGAHFGIACLPRILGKKRAHEANISANSELTLRSRIQVWKKVRHRFPSLAPADVMTALCAETYLQLGYILLTTDRRKEARQASLKSLTYAIQHYLVSGSTDMSLPSYRWDFAIGLLPLTFLGWSTTRSLWRFSHALVSKSEGKTLK